MIFLLGMVVGGIVGAMIGFISIACVMPDEKFCAQCGEEMGYVPSKIQ